MAKKTVENRVTTGGTPEKFPKEVLTLCKKEGIKPADVVEHRVGGREPRKTLTHGFYWVYPVSILLKDGRKITGEVVKFND